MTEDKIIIYSKAYVELYELIKYLPNNEQSKISETFLENLRKDMSKDYSFYIDTSKDILEQNFMVETKALFIEVYKEYIADDEEKKIWSKYDVICSNMMEDEKRKIYNVDNIFDNKKDIKNTIESDESSNLPICVDEKNIFKRFISIIKKIFHIN